MQSSRAPNFRLTKALASRASRDQVPRESTIALDSTDSSGESSSERLRAAVRCESAGGGVVIGEFMRKDFAVAKPSRPRFRSRGRPRRRPLTVALGQITPIASSAISQP